MPSAEHRQVTEAEFGAIVLERIRAAGTRRVSDGEVAERLGTDGHLDIQVALPFRVKVRFAPTSDETRGRLPQPCCICINDGGKITCLGSCC
jgi:hypothetical protein